MTTESENTVADQGKVPAPGRRGRPVGWRMPTIADLQALTLEDFAFVRAVAEGIEPGKAFLRYYGNRFFDSEGNPEIPHGLAINSQSEKLLKKIVEAALLTATPHTLGAAQALMRPLPAQVAAASVKVQMHMDFEEWLSGIDPDLYRENELPDAYKDYLVELGVESDADQARHSAGPTLQDKLADVDHGLARKAKIDAINLLQAQLAKLPAPDDGTVIWLSRPLQRGLSLQGVGTMGEFVAFVERVGRHWHRSVKGLGPGRARRVEAWLEDHSATLGEVDKSGTQWGSAPGLQTRIVPLQRAPEVIELVYLPGATQATPRNNQLELRFGVAPLELMIVPAHLLGHNGLFRTNSPNHMGAKNDLDAVMIWLNTYLSAGKMRTFEAYRREIERFYVWCILEAQCALSSVSLGHAQGYQAWLKAIPDKYIGSARVARDHPDWRPFRGQLEPLSQNYAIGVLHQFYEALRKNAYVTGNPFGSVRPSVDGKKTRIMDTSRSLSASDLNLVREALATLPGLSSPDLLEAALARRIKLILHLALTTGMRLDEMANATLTSLRRPVVDDIESDAEWMISVTGKGSKVRDLPIQESVLTMIRAHHADWIALMPAADHRRKAFEATPPLIAALQAPVRSKHRDITDETVLANDNAALGRDGLARTLKTFFRQTSKRGLSALASQLQLAEANSSTKAAEIQRLKREIEKFKRIETMSTHWLRHTFAKGVIRNNEGDEGLKLAQQLLGHQSISTTAQYVKQDESGKVKAARKVNPLGF